MYQVLARKWRPRGFSELVGQQHVARTLSNAIEADRLAHAYIFAGLRGTGKTTIARILAKCLNCEQGPCTEPCNVCASCTEIAESRSMDVMEIDAASRTKVEQTRELLEMVSYAPVRDRFKILIIDEAHMLSKSSFNALLKTLEEPPPNVIFILATTELQKVIPTIVSRCQIFEFRRVGPDELTRYLRRVCDAETVEISDVALDRLARAGEGSVRDSLSLLERALAFSGPRIEDEDLLRMLGAVRGRVLAEILAALARRDAAAMLRVLDGLIDEGHDLVHLWNELIAAVRDLLMMQAVPDRPELLARSPDEARDLAEAADGLGREDLTRVFQLLADLETGLKGSSQPRFLFEAALIRLADLGAVRPIEEILATLGAGRLQANTSAPAPAPPPEKKSPDVARERPTPEVEPRATPATAAGSGATADELMDAIRTRRPMVGAMLEQASIELADDRLAVRLPSGMDALKRQLDTPDSVELIRSEASRITGRELQVEIEVGVEARADATDRAADAPPSGKSARKSDRASGASRPSKRGRADAPDPSLMKEARKEPGVRSLLDVFGAHVVDIRRVELAAEGDEESPRHEEEQG